VQGSSEKSLLSVFGIRLEEEASRFVHVGPFWIGDQKK
jgi:hypothetical protein